MALGFSSKLSAVYGVGQAVMIDAHYPVVRGHWVGAGSNTCGCKGGASTAASGVLWKVPQVQKGLQPERVMSAR
jgi:hypothetical protein